MLKLLKLKFLYQHYNNPKNHKKNEKKIFVVFNMKIFYIHNKVLTGFTTARKAVAEEAWRLT